MKERQIRTLKRYFNKKLELLFNEWKNEIYIDGFYYCPVCNYKTNKLSNLSSHIGNRDILEIYYQTYLMKNNDNFLCKECGKISNFISITKGYSKYCSDECTYSDKVKRLKSLEVKEKRENSLKLYQSLENKEQRKLDIKKCKEKRSKSLKIYFKNEDRLTKEKRCKKQSKTMISLIKNGKFIPNINNTWNGKIIKYRGIKFRSSWEVAFYILNEKLNLEYEKLIIQYNFKKERRNYIIDFIDKQNKIIYEIKPNLRLNDKINVCKEKSLKKWCIENSYQYKIITEDYFIENFNEYNFNRLPEEVKKRMNVIYEESKNKKN